MRVPAGRNGHRLIVLESQSTGQRYNGRNTPIENYQPMHLTRRSVLSFLCLPAARVYGQAQGMASRVVKAAPRAKPSGLPFGARFTDVAQQAGLKEIVVGGHPDRCDYI